jgi:hypothetical protein
MSFNKNQILANLKNAQKIEYRGYTIDEHWELYAQAPNFMFYPSDEGIQHDADYDGESYKYSGNCQWAESVDEAKDEIDSFLDRDLIDYYR